MASEDHRYHRKMGNVQYTKEDPLKVAPAPKKRHWWQRKAKDVKPAPSGAPFSMKAYNKSKKAIIALTMKALEKYGYDATYQILVACSESIEPYNATKGLYKKFE